MRNPTIHPPRNYRARALTAAITLLAGCGGGGGGHPTAPDPPTPPAPPTQFSVSTTLVTLSQGQALEVSFAIDGQELQRLDLAGVGGCGLPIPCIVGGRISGVAPGSRHVAEVRIHRQSRTTIRYTINGAWTFVNGSAVTQRALETRTVTLRAGDVVRYEVNL